MSTASRNLPPLAPNNEEPGEENDTPRKRKKKRQPTTEGDGKREKHTRSRSSSLRRRQDEQVGTQHTQSQEEMPSGSEIEDAENTQRKKRRPKNSSQKRETKSRTQEADEEMDRSHGDEGENKQRKKKKPRTDSKEALVDENATNGDVVRKKKRRKKKIRAEEEEKEEDDFNEFGDDIAQDILALKDDIVIPEDDDLKKEDTDDFRFMGPSMHSTAMERVFIENRGGFKNIDKGKLARQRAEAEANARKMEPKRETTSTIQLALQTHKLTKTFALFCHGLLAGYALWHIVMVFILSSGENDFGTLLKYYHPVALPVQSLYYFLFAICTLSVFDSYDVGRPEKSFIRVALCSSGGVAIVIYFLSLLLSVSMAAIDDKIYLYKVNSTLWSDVKARDSEMLVWRSLNIARGAGAILGWVVVSITPNADRLSDNLEKADENIIGESNDMMVLRSSGV